MILFFVFYVAKPNIKDLALAYKKKALEQVTPAVTKGIKSSAKSRKSMMLVRY